MKNIYDIFNSKNLTYSIILCCLLYLFSLYVIQEIIIYDPQSITGGNQRSVIAYRNFFHIIYFVYPLYIFLKIFFISIIINISYYFQKNNIRFKEIMQIVCIAYIGYWLQYLVEILWFLIINKNYSMFDVTNYSFLSLYNFFNTKSPYIEILLKNLDIFELLFWYILIKGVVVVSKLSITKSVKLITFTYGLIFIFSIIAKIYFYSKMHPSY